MTNEPDLTQFPLFGQLPPPVLDELKKNAVFSVAEQGKVFSNQGEFTGTFHVVLSGGVGAYRTESDGSVKMLDHLGPGAWFGEVSALSNQPSLATLKAEVPCVLVSVPPATFKTLYQRVPAFKKQIDDKYRERSLAVHLRIAPLFRNLPKEQLEALRQGVEFLTFPAQHVVAKAGEEAQALVMVRSGAVQCVRRTPEGREEIVGYFMTNSSFGERSLTDGDRRWPGDYVTMTPTDVLRVPVATIRSVFGSDAATLRQLSDAAALLTAEEGGAQTGVFEQTREGRRQGQVDQRELEQMVRKGSAKGGEALVIDLERCVRCNACVESCVAVHDDHVPRLSKKGSRVTFEEDDGAHHRFNLATSCYNCQVPGCMLSCSFGAIRRDVQGLIRFDYDNCVGCAMCVSACPYDVIRLAPKPGQGAFLEQKGLLEQIPLLGRLFKKKEAEATPVEEGPAVLNANGIPVQAKAIKCDLCAGLPFESCVYNCPTSAIKRMSPEQLFKMKKVDSKGTFSFTR